MPWIKCNNDIELRDLSHHWLEQSIVKHKAHSVFIPAGQTPILLYEKWEKEKPNFLKNLELWQIDEVISGKSAGMFRNFFEQNLPSYQSQIQYITTSPRCLSVDLAILGFGTNGHVAFHEPHLPANFAYGEVTLSDPTCQKLGLEKNTRGLTYGCASFLRCKAILLMVSGKGKQKAFAEFCRQNTQAMSPASLLKAHTDLEVVYAIGNTKT